MSKLCINCHYLGQPKQKYFFASFYLGLGMIIGGAISLSSGSNYVSDIFTLVFSITWMSLGAICILFYIYGSNTCPNCKNNKMIPLDDPEAIELIKKHDLKVSEEKSKESSKQST